MNERTDHIFAKIKNVNISPEGGLEPRTSRSAAAYANHGTTALLNSHTPCCCRRATQHIGLEEILKSPDALLLYPSKDAVEIFRLPSVSERKSPYDLIVIDGTWPQAKAIFHATPLLHNIRQVKLVHGLISEYVIRSQPTDGCLSTLEAAAQALSHLEDRADVTDVLLRPMHALCNFQLDYGAVTHSSTEARVRNGTYPRQIGKRLSRLLAANSEIDDTSCT
ncbi:tRNA-uridine aminocarboxypropyltransferase 2 isoform X3 [Schistocerca nitens]|uniref:tRNA-uridine aminocarboxypropyltransferase 2 isoform X3 n=1 Tax=Schistocerca nitens TaxID=7011 RepID=UPI002118B964|nr:tRNA-uridine aminocarboxypropyltransferase 2 isoform X3 [Schistocerca nitens]